MKITRIAIAGLCCIGSALAQDAGQDNDNRNRVPVALQEALDLSDTQIDQLRDNNRTMGDEIRPVARQIADKRREMRLEMRAESPNESIIGTITMERQQLTDEVQAIQAKYQTSAKELLTFDQLFKLQPIEAAAAFTFEVRQADQYNLVMLPEPDQGDSGGARQQPGGPIRRR